MHRNIDKTFDKNININYHSNMKINKQDFNKEKADKLKAIAQRSIKVVNALEAGMDSSEIILQVPNCERALVHYYIKALTK